MFQNTGFVGATSSRSVLQVSLQGAVEGCVVGRRRFSTNGDPELGTPVPGPWLLPMRASAFERACPPEAAPRRARAPQRLRTGAAKRSGRKRARALDMPIPACPWVRSKAAAALAIGATEPGGATLRRSSSLTEADASCEARVPGRRAHSDPGKTNPRGWM